MMCTDTNLFDKSIKDIKRLVKELQNSEQNIEQKILFIAERLRERNLKHMAKKDVARIKDASTDSIKSLSSLTYLVLLKKNNALAFRMNHIGAGKEDFIPVLEE